MKIRFSHNYPKLHGQTSAILIELAVVDRSTLTEKFIEYDTVFDGGYYPLPPGRYVVLVFLGNEFIPFTTVRGFSAIKYGYYHDGIGHKFDIEIVANPKAGR
jgi:hypothetical protein